MSHTKKDKDCCDKFDSAVARVGIKVFRSEFETLESPAWKTIKNEINKSCALFLLVGKELVKAQAESETIKEAKEKWKFTQNWISYEVGLACQLGIDVWVMCDSVEINFPVPYLNNYDVYGIRREITGSLDWIRGVFEKYSKGGTYRLGQLPEGQCTCPFCGAIFNLHSQIQLNTEVPCPTCLNDMWFDKGWLL